MGSAQYIRDNDGKLLQKLEENRARWIRAVASLLNTTSAAFNRTIIDGLLPKPVTLSLGDPPVLNEIKPALSYMANCKAMGPNELPAELPKLGFATVPTKSCLHSTASSWLCGWRGKYPGSEKSQPSEFYPKRRIGPSVTNTGASLWWRMPARFFSKSWPIDLVTSARKL